MERLESLLKATQPTQGTRGLLLQMLPREASVPSPLTCELALLQETLQERRVGEEHLLQPLSTHVEDGVDEEAAREVGKQGGQVTWETKGASSHGYTLPFPWANWSSSLLGLPVWKGNSSS